MSKDPVGGVLPGVSETTVVISDTSPINYLVLIGEPGILEHLWDETAVCRCAGE